MTLAATAAARSTSALDVRPPPSSTRFARLRPVGAAAFPLAFIFLLGAIGSSSAIRQQGSLASSIWGAAAFLLAWTAVVAAGAHVRGRTFTVDVVLRKQHYLQACAQGSVLVYWGWYWREVYAAVPLIAAQLAFAYAFDMLLAWTRRDDYTLGFGPFPVIFSINLFLWFKAEWFYLQFLMIAVGFAAKELIRWRKDGRLVHIFNPSSFPLALFSLGLILTHSTSLTWGQEIAETQLRPPNIYLMLFLVGLPGQYFFGVTTMTLSAVVTMYVFGLLYFAATGTYYFTDAYIPIAVFLGMHLLFTDPSTSPRTELGRLVFGALYALSIIALYALLGMAGVPSFYDKLLPVPILNLAITLIDDVARSAALKRVDPARIGTWLSGRSRNLAYMTVWTLVFVVMSAAQGVGDTHRGHWMPFWRVACQEGRPNGCRTLALMEATYCRDGSGWACNEFGARLADGAGGPSAARAAMERPRDYFSRACDLGYAPGCENARAVQTGSGPVRRGPPRLADYPIVLLEGKGPVPDRTPIALSQRACTQGWMSGCESLAIAYLRGDGTARDPARAAREFDRACSGGEATACSNAGLMYRNADGVARDDARALAYLTRACELGVPSACRWVDEKRQQ
jgi:Sel1 repeat